MPRLAVQAVVLIALAVAAPSVAMASERSDFQKAQSVGTQSAYQDFLQKHPDSKFSPMARDRLARLEQERARADSASSAYREALEGARVQAIAKIAAYQPGVTTERQFFADGWDTTACSDHIGILRVVRGPDALDVSLGYNEGVPLASPMAERMHSILKMCLASAATNPEMAVDCHCASFERRGGPEATVRVFLLHFEKGVLTRSARLN